MVNSKAWLEGMKAGQDGMPEYLNPYRGGQDMQSWFDGRKAGCRSVEARSEKG